MSEGISQWMVPCPVKAWTGWDCPGCGFQRSLWALVQGDVAESWAHYPALIPFLITLVLVVVWVRGRWRFRNPALVGAVALTCVLMVGNFWLKGGFSQGRAMREAAVHTHRGAPESCANNSQRYHINSHP